MEPELLNEIGKTGNTAFMLLATSLVMLMTPGLAFFMVDWHQKETFWEL